MSRPNIRFIYTGQFRSEVKQIQKGPANLQNLKSSYLLPQQIQGQNNDESSSNTQIISKVQVNSKPTSPNGMNRYLSADNLHLEKKGKQDESNLILNIEQKESQAMTFNNNAKNNKKSKNGHNQQIVLNAPSYKFVPKKEGESSPFFTKQFFQNGVIQKIINNGQSNVKTQKRIKAHKNQTEQKEQNPLLKLQVMNEKQFKGQSYDSQMKGVFKDDKLVLKAPRYKYTPSQQGNIVVHRKKQYSKAQNAEKYLYNGIQQKRQSQFIQCFDCKEPRVMKYKARQG